MVVKKRPRFYEIRRFVNGVQKSHTPDHILSQTDPVRSLTPHSFTVYFNVVFPRISISPSGLSALASAQIICVQTSHISCMLLRKFRKYHIFYYVEHEYNTAL